MGKKYVLVDFMNMAHRAKNVVRGDVDTQIGMAMHIIFNSIKNVFKQFDGDHLVVCCEGNSWRKQVDTRYKKNRIVKQLEKSISEQEDDKIFMSAMLEFEEYLALKTRVSLLKCPVAEADDMIAIFIDSHPDDEHVIISADTDYIQLLADNVKIYNGVAEHVITLDGYFTIDGKEVKDNKTKEHRKIDDPEYMLFEKCIRGDKSDNIFSAYPGVRKKGTKNQVGILAAYADRHNKGYDWNNFMLSTWIDAEDNEQVVGERYEANRLLIDLKLQPDDIRQECIVSMAHSLAKAPVDGVGINFLRFCRDWNLNKISQYPDQYCNILNKKYTL